MKRENMNSFAVVAPDTDSGKTVITAALLKCSLKKRGKSTVMKPVQTGATIIDGKRYSPDITEIERLTGKTIPQNIYNWVVPFNFYAPCSPHLAAKKELQKVNFKTIKRSLEQLTLQHRMTIVETAGGVLSPLTDTETNIDLLVELNTPVVVVAQNRLGAISATLTAIESLKSANVAIQGLIMIDPETVKTELDREILADNITTISRIAEIDNSVRIPFLENLTEEFDTLEMILDPFAEILFGENECSSCNV